MMRILLALSITVVMAAANGAFACPIHSASQDTATEAGIISSLNEPVLLNGDDSSQAEKLRLAQIANALEPVLLNREDFSHDVTLPQSDEAASPSWEELDVMPSVVASLELPRLIVLVDDGGVPQFDIEHTGSNPMRIGTAPHVPADGAIDGFEDR